MRNQLFHNDVICPELSYQLVGILFDVHNRLGRFCKEKQYCNMIEKFLKEQHIPYNREARITIDGSDTDDRADFIVDNRVIMEIKTKPAIERCDYTQVKRYLEQGEKKLGLLINFRNKYLRPIRILNSRYSRNSHHS